MWLLNAAPLLIEDFLTLNLLAALLTVFIFGIGELLANFNLPKFRQILGTEFYLINS
jgi:hypothetical protein